MRPEKNEPKIELGEDEKIVIDLLKAHDGSMPLQEIKEKSQLSGKKWDKASKTLAKLEMTKVEVEGDSKTMKLVV
jgi:lysyl-tRNA synthetase class 2